jgi:hypothetical protein
MGHIMTSKMNLWYGVGIFFSRDTSNILKILRSNLVCRSYELAKLQDSYLFKIGNFWDFSLRAPRHSTTLMQPPLLVIKYTIGEEMVSPFQVWLIVCFVTLVHSWLVHAPFWLQLALYGFVLSLCNLILPWAHACEFILIPS